MIKIYAVIAGVILLSGFAWLREHDNHLKWQVLAEARADSLDHEQKVTEGFRRAVTAMDSALAVATKRYLNDKKASLNVIGSLQHRIDSLASEIAEQLPDSMGGTLARLVQSCNRQRELLTATVDDCERLRAQGLETVAKRDTIIQRVQSSRDAYRKLFEESQQVRKADAWATVGKIETAVGVLAGVTKLFGLW